MVALRPIERIKMLQVFVGGGIDMLLESVCVNDRFTTYNSFIRIVILASVIGFIMVCGWQNAKLRFKVPGKIFGIIEAGFISYFGYGFTRFLE